MIWMKFRGERCDDAKYECILEKIPLDIKAEKTTQIIEMPTGEPIIYEPGGYKQQIVTVTLGLRQNSPEYVQRINQWLTGAGKLIFSNDPDAHYMAVCNTALSGTRMVQNLGKLPVQFTVMPFKRDNDEEFHTIDLWTNGYGGKSGNTGGDNDHPPGSAPAKPAFKVYWSNLNSLHMTHKLTYTDVDIDLTGLTDHILIDCQTGKVYDKDNNVILSRVVGNIDAIVNPGGNYGTFDFSAEVTQVDCRFNRRWL